MRARARPGQHASDLRDPRFPPAKDVHLPAEGGDRAVSVHSKGGAGHYAVPCGAHGAQGEQGTQLSPAVAFTVRVAENRRKAEAGKELGALVIARVGPAHPARASMMLPAETPKRGFPASTAGGEPSRRHCPAGPACPPPRLRRR